MKKLVLLSLGLIVQALGPKAVAFDDATYDQLFPISVQYCGLTALEKKSGLGAPVAGGEMGHGVIYLRGACRDLNSSYPRIERCDPKNTSQTGVGVSVNSDFENVNWVANQDKNFFFHGILQPGEPVTTESYYRTEAKAKEMEILRNVTYHQSNYQRALPGMSQEEFRYEDSYGTDYAINYARKMYCVHVPLTETELKRMIDFLNAKNEYYLSNGGYTWSIHNNCSTLDYNAMSAAGFFPEIATNVALGLIEVATPMNAFVDLTSRVNDLPLENIGALFKDETIRLMLHEQGLLPARAGGLVEFSPMHAPNAAFNLKIGGGEIVDVPFVHPFEGEMQKFFTTDRYQNLTANLQYFLTRLKKIKASQRPWKDYIPARGEDPTDWTGFHQFYTEYFKYVDHQITETERKLAQVMPNML